MRKPAFGTYAAWPLVWVVVSTFGCLAGAAVDGWDRLGEFLLRYSLGVGAIIAVFAVLAYSRDMRTYRRLENDSAAGR